MGMANGKSKLDGYDKVAVLDRQRKALQMRRDGADFDAIAEACGYSNRSGAYKAVMTALKKMMREPADELRSLELERLDRLYTQMARKAEGGDEKAVDRCLRIMERRARLLGLDAPVKQDVTSGGEPVRIVVKVEPE